jgi:5-methylcytosine-specific restriction endonuclease McrA
MSHKTFPKPPPKPPARKKRLALKSEKARDYEEQLDAITPALTSRSQGMCELCKTATAVVRHHRLRRSQGGKNTLRNLLHLCVGCHDRVHTYPTLSYEQGWLLRK